MSEAAQLGSALAEADPVLAELIGEITDRLNAGERVDVEAYVARHPERAEQLRRLLPALEVLGGLGTSGAAGPGAGEGGLAGCLGDFRLLREIGRGGMGIVYEAEQISLGRRVALKVLPFAGALDARQLQRFKHEAQAAACLHHTNIVPVHYVGCERGVHFYTMQLIEGRPLSAVIQELRQLNGLERDGPSTAAAAASGNAADTATRAALTTTTSIHSREFIQTVTRWGVQAAEALEYAHQMGVIHRDVKPANLLVDERGQLWITDFGLARSHHLDAGLTMTGDLLGTMRYMSPEQTQGRSVLIDNRTDIYSLGVTLYELLTLERAFAAIDRSELLREIAQDEPRPPRRLNRTVPAELETIVLKAIGKGREERYAAAQELADDLQRFLEDKPVRARRPSLSERLAKWSRRHRGATRAAVVVLLVTMVGLAIGSYLIWQKEKETRAALEQVEEQRRVAQDNAAKAKKQRQRAETNLDAALNDMIVLLSRLGAKESAAVPQIREFRRRAYEDLVSRFQGWLDEQSTDPAVRYDTARTYLSLGQLHAMQPEPGLAEEAMRKAVAILRGLTEDYPTDPAYWSQLAHSRVYLASHLKLTGLAAQAREEYCKAIEAFYEVARLAPEDARSPANLAWTLATCEIDEIRKPKEAVKLASKGVELNPKISHTWKILGVAQYRAGNWEAAVVALEKSIELRAREPRLQHAYDWFYLAMAHKRIGHEQKAQECFARGSAWVDEHCPEDPGWSRLRDEAAAVLELQVEPKASEKK